MILVFLLSFIVLLLIYNVYYKTQKKFDFFKQNGIPYYQDTRTLWKGLFGLTTANTTFTDVSKQLYSAMPTETLHGIVLNGIPIMVVKDPELIGLIMIKHFDSFTDHTNSFFDADFDPFISKTIFSLKGVQWQQMRTVLSPAFTGSKMRGIFQLMRNCASQMVEYIGEKVDANGSQIELEFKELCSRFSNDVIATTAFGLEVNSFSDPNNTFYKMGVKSSNINTKTIVLQNYFPLICKWLKIKLIPEEVVNYFEKIFTETVIYREKENVMRPDMLQLLIQAKHGTLTSEGKEKPSESKRTADLTYRDMAAQAFLFFIGGFETVSTTICFVLYELARYPDIQTKLYEEIKAHFEKDNQITYDDLKEMKFLDMTISETLRMRPLAPLLDRLCTKTVTLNGSNGKQVTFEAGSCIQVPIIGFHYDAKYFEDPEKFDPERFSTENKSQITPFTYIPFGTGPRNCIGSRFALMEAKLFVSYFLMSFELVPTEKTEIPLILEPNNLNTKPKNGLWIGIRRRK